MRWFLFAAVVIAWPAAPAFAADDPKPAQPTEAELKKQIADLESLIAKKKLDRDLAEAAVKATYEEYARIRKAGAAKVSEQVAPLGKALRDLSDKADKARDVARKAEKDFLAAERARNATNDQLKGATDPKELADLKKKLTEEETAVAAKKEVAEKTKAALKDVVEEERKIADAVRAKVKEAQKVADAASETAASEIAKARAGVVKICNELDAVAEKLRQARDQLADLKR